MFDILTRISNSGNSCSKPKQNRKKKRHFKEREVNQAINNSMLHTHSTYSCLYNYPCFLQNINKYKSSGCKQQAPFLIPSKLNINSSYPNKEKITNTQIYPKIL